MVKMDDAEMTALINDQTIWFDDTTTIGRSQGVLVGSMEIIPQAMEDWNQYDRNPNAGLTADIKLEDIKEVSFGDQWQLVSYKRTSREKGLIHIERLRCVRRFIKMDPLLSLLLSAQA